MLLTDGVQTDGDLLAESSRARRFGVKLFAVPYHRPVPGEVAVRDLRAPDRVRVGEPFDLHAQIFSSRPQTVKATLKQGEAINGLEGVRAVDLKAGDNDVPFKSVVRVAGEVTYALDVSDVPEDRFAENNRYAVTLAVPGRPSVLYVEGNTQRASYLASALTAQDFDVDVRGPSELPSSLRELERYDFVILSDAPAEQVSLTQQDAIEQYVRDLGGGFLFAGGENGYGLGGWYHTTIERILPVRMDAEKRRDEPGVAMVLVIDRSGSMSGLPLEMAKAAAKATADTLSPEDLLEVVAFDSQPTRIVKMTPAKHRARIQNDIARIQPGGGTEIFGALDAAYQALTVTRARRKHVILLTDGQAPPNGIRDLVQAMTAEGITVSSVGLGAGIDETLLRMISDIGGGRFYKVIDPQSLPRVFTRETEMVSRSAAVEEYFQPKVVGPADFLRGIDIGAAPFLHGYVATKMKPPPAQEILESELGEPILARWHVGLGWSLAWTSDVKNLWAVEWLKWPQYGQFWGQLVREHMRQKKRQQLGMRAEVDPATGHVKAAIDAIDADDTFENGLDAKLRITGPQPNGPTRDVPMHQTAPGRYEADFPLDRYGSFLLHAGLEKTVDEASAQGGAVYRGRRRTARRDRRRELRTRDTPVPSRIPRPRPRRGHARARCAGDGRGALGRSARAVRSGGGVDSLPRGPLAALRLCRDRAHAARSARAPRPDLRPEADGAERGERTWGGTGERRGPERPSRAPSSRREPALARHAGGRDRALSGERRPSPPNPAAFARSRPPAHRKLTSTCRPRLRGYRPAVWCVGVSQNGSIRSRRTSGSLAGDGRCRYNVRTIGFLLASSPARARESRSLRSRCACAAVLGIDDGHPRAGGAGVDGIDHRSFGPTGERPVRSWRGRRRLRVPRCGGSPARARPRRGPSEDGFVDA